MNARVKIAQLVAAACGMLAGTYLVNEQPHALIVAPKVEGEFEMPWLAERAAVKGAESYVDGLANTDAMVAAGSDLAKTIRALRIGGFEDWYLPSRLEALIIFSEIGRDKDAAFERDWYWTSTQVAGGGAYAWVQDFYYGGQFSNVKDWSCRARAVRRVPIR